MQRDWEIIRAVLGRLEAANKPNAVVDAEDFDAFDAQSVAYNMRLLEDDGCIEAKILDSSTGDNRIAKALAIRLTASGHDLLDVLRSDSVWERIKERFRREGMEMTVDLVREVGKRIMRSALLS